MADKPPIDETTLAWLSMAQMPPEVPEQARRMIRYMNDQARARAWQLLQRKQIDLERVGELGPDPAREGDQNLVRACVDLVRAELSEPMGPGWDEFRARMMRAAWQEMRGHAGRIRGLATGALPFTPQTAELAMTLAALVATELSCLEEAERQRGGDKAPPEA